MFPFFCNDSAVPLHSMLRDSEKESGTVLYNRVTGHANDIGKGSCFSRPKQLQDIKRNIEQSSSFSGKYSLNSEEY